MVEDENKFEEYQQFCRMRQAEELTAQDQQDQARNRRQREMALNLFTGESSDSSDEDDADSQASPTSKQGKKVNFDFDHPGAFFKYGKDPSGRRPDNFIIKNRERITYGNENNSKLSYLKLQYKLQNEAAVRSKQQENQMELYKRKLFLVSRHDIL